LDEKIYLSDLEYWRNKKTYFIASVVLTASYAGFEYQKQIDAMNEKEKNVDKMQSADSPEEINEYWDKANTNIEEANEHKRNAELSGMLSLALLSYTIWLHYDKPSQPASESSLMFLMNRQNRLSFAYKFRW
jgi:hypothetical protein